MIKFAAISHTILKANGKASGAGFPADGVFCGRNEGEIGHIRCGGWRQYGYIYEKERSRLAKIEKIPAGPEKTLIFFVKNDTLRKSTQSIASLLSAFV